MRVWPNCSIPVRQLHCGVFRGQWWSEERSDNFRFARQPPTIVTWAELDFYDLPLIRPSGFVNSGRPGFSNQELGELRMDRRGCGNSSEAIPFLSIIPNMLSRLKRRGFKTLEIELVQTKELAYGVSGSR